MKITCTGKTEDVREPVQDRFAALAQTFALPFQFATKPLNLNVRFATKANLSSHIHDAGVLIGRERRQSVQG